MERSESQRILMNRSCWVSLRFNPAYKSFTNTIDFRW